MLSFTGLLCAVPSESIIAEEELIPANTDQEAYSIRKLLSDVNYCDMKTKRVWFVLAGCMLMYGAMMGILFNCAGVLINGVIQAEGYTSSSVSSYYTLRGLVSTVAMIFTAKILTKVNIKVMVVMVGFIGSLSFFLMSMYTQPWQWAISGVLHGIGSSLVVLLPTSVIRAWFIKNRGTFMGVYMMLSGVIGAIFNPLAGKLIQSVGWRNTAVILASTAFTLVFISALLIVRKPSDVGALPYGGEEEPDTDTKTPSASTADRKHVPIKLGTYLYIFCSVTVAGLAIQMVSYVPQYASSLGYDTMIGAKMTSILMIGNMSAKVLFGVCSDYVGLWRSIQIFLGLIGSGLVILTAGSGVPLLLDIGALLMGFGYMNGVANSLVSAEIFEPDQFEIQYSRLSMLSGLSTAISPSIISGVYDSTGSFKPVFMFLAAWLFIAILLISLREKLGIVKPREESENS